MILKPMIEKMMIKCITTIRTNKDSFAQGN